MNTSILRWVLWAHTLIAGAAGLAFYLFPSVAASLWPWPLPGLAARFVGALLISGATYSGLTVTARNDLPIAGTLLTASGYSLIALVGVIHGGELGWTAQLLIWAAIWAITALIFVVLLIMVQARGLFTTDATRPMPPAARAFFTLHMLLVAPVGLVMYLAPSLAQSLWPWTLTPINIQLVGAMFVVTAVLSFWCRRQRAWSAIAPALATYGTFTTLALIASLIHFSLFNPTRLVTWVFLGVYIVVAGGAWYLLWTQRRSRQAFS
jgi:hypothetical protein